MIIINNPCYETALKRKYLSSNNTDNLHLIFPPTPHTSSLTVTQPPDGLFQKHQCDAIFIECSHTYTLF